MKKNLIAFGLLFALCTLFSCVDYKPDAGLKLDPSSKDLPVGQSFVLTASDADSVQWTVDNPMIVSLEPDSMQATVTGLQEGLAVVAAKAGDATRTCVVNVIPVVTED